MLTTALTDEAYRRCVRRRVAGIDPRDRRWGVALISCLLVVVMTPTVVAANDTNIGACTATEQANGAVALRIELSRYRNAPVSIVRNGRWLSTVDPAPELSVEVSGSADDEWSFRQTNRGSVFTQPCAAPAGPQVVASVFAADFVAVDVNDSDQVLVRGSQLTADRYDLRPDGSFLRTEVPAASKITDRGVLVDERALAVSPAGSFVTSRPEPFAVTSPSGEQQPLDLGESERCTAAAFHGDDLLAVGCTGERPAAVRIFERNGTGRFEATQVIFTPEDGYSDRRFGFDLAFGDDATLFIADPTWNPTTPVGDFAGSFDEDSRGEAGAVYVFEPGEKGYVLTQRLSAPGVRFGLGIDTLGDELIATTERFDKIHTFERTSTDEFDLVRSVDGPNLAFNFSYAFIRGLSDGRFVTAVRDRLLVFDPSDTDRPGVPRPKATVDHLVDAPQREDRSVQLSWGTSVDEGTIAGHEVRVERLVDGRFSARTYFVPAAPTNSLMLRGLLEGEYRLSVRSFDSGGNRSWRTGFTTFALAGDVERPSPPGAPSASPSPSDPAVTRFTFRPAQDNVAVVRYELFRADGTPFSTFSWARFVAPDGQPVIALRDIAPGSYELYARAYDAEGNESYRSGISSVVIG